MQTTCCSNAFPEEDLQSNFFLQLNGGKWEDSVSGKILRSYVIWINESQIELHPKGKGQNRRKCVGNPESMPLVPIPKFSLNSMVAGGIIRCGTLELHMDYTYASCSIFFKKIKSFSISLSFLFSSLVGGSTLQYSYMYNL